MSTRNRVLAALPLLWLCLARAEAPQLGAPLSEAEAESASYTVMPDGRGLPEGHGTAAQGRKLYRVHCLACHGENGEGGPNDRLAGGRGSLDGPQPVKTVGSYWPEATTLFDYLRRAMPYTAPGSLEPDELYALTAYVLHLNGIVGDQEVIDAESLPRVKMPNREKFDRAWPPQVP